jgi:hypothetical protein
VDKIIEALQAEMISDVRADGRAHARYLQVLDRAFLSNYLEGSDATGGRLGELNASSHVPTSQPFVVPNFVTPAGTTVK